MRTKYFFKKTCVCFAIALATVGLKAQTIVDGVAYNLIGGSDPAAAEVVALPDDEKYTGSITIQANVEIEGTTYPVKKIGDGSLRDAPDLTEVIIPEGLEIIGNSSFASCTGITELVLPSTLNSIEDWAFYECLGLTSMVLPENTKTIGAQAFHKSSNLATINIPEGSTIGGNAFNQSGLTNITINNVASIGDWAFSNCANLKDITIKDVENVNGNGFRPCPSLESVSFENVETIGGWIFQNCATLETVNLGDKLQVIEGGAFSGCTALTTLVIPSSVTSIKDWSLEKTGITEIYASWDDPASVTFEDNAFGSGDGKINFTWKVPADVADAYGDMLEGYPVVEGIYTGIEDNLIGCINAYYANGNLYVNDLAGYSVSVIALDGRTIANYPVAQINCSIPVSLASGVYLIKAEKRSKTIAAKIVVK